MKEKILVVDDDKEILNLISIYLINEGYEVVKALNGYEALEKLNENPQLLIIDVMMPDINGIEVCKIVRQSLNIPIIMLSAKVQNIDKIEGILAGADDYITKPFDQLEFIVRVRALIRRTYLFNNNLPFNKDEDLLTIGDLTINKSTHSVVVNNDPIILTSTEFEILYLLADNAGKVFSSEELFEKVWKEQYFQTNNTVMVHISNLRNKLENHLNGVKIIHTVWGVGYKIEKK